MDENFHMDELDNIYLHVKFHWYHEYFVLQNSSRLSFHHPWTINFPHMVIFIHDHFYPYVISFMLATSIHMMNSIHVHNSSINIVSFMSYNAYSSYQFHPYGHDHFHPFGQIYLWKKAKVSLGGITRNVTISF